MKYALNDSEDEKRDPMASVYRQKWQESFQEAVIAKQVAEEDEEISNTPIPYNRTDSRRSAIKEKNTMRSVTQDNKSIPSNSNSDNLSDLDQTGESFRDKLIKRNDGTRKSASRGRVTFKEP